MGSDQPDTTSQRPEAPRSHQTYQEVANRAQRSHQTYENSRSNGHNGYPNGGGYQGGNGRPYNGNGYNGYNGNGYNGNGYHGPSYQQRYQPVANNHMSNPSNQERDDQQAGHVKSYLHHQGHLAQLPQQPASHLSEDGRLRHMEAKIAEAKEQFDCKLKSVTQDMQKDVEAAINDQHEKAHSKFNLIFGILSELSTRQTQLEEALRESVARNQPQGAAGFAYVCAGQSPAIFAQPMEGFTQATQGFQMYGANMGSGSAVPVTTPSQGTAQPFQGMIQLKKMMQDENAEQIANQEAQSMQREHNSSFEQEWKGGDNQDQDQQSMWRQNRTKSMWNNRPNTGSYSTFDGKGVGKGQRQMRPEMILSREAEASEVEANIWSKRVTFDAMTGTASIDMGGCSLGDDGVVRWCKWMSEELRRMRREYQTNHASRSGERYIVAKQLTLSANGLSDEACAEVVHFITATGLRCERLKLHENKLSDGCVDSLVQLLKMCNHYPVKELHLSHNAITDKGLTKLFEAIAQSTVYPCGPGKFVPLWLRIEHNPIASLQDVIDDVRNRCGLGTCVADPDIHQRRSGNNHKNCGPRWCKMSEVPHVHVVFQPGSNQDSPVDRCPLIDKEKWEVKEGNFQLITNEANMPENNGKKREVKVIQARTNEGKGKSDDSAEVLELLQPGKLQIMEDGEQEDEGDAGGVKDNKEFSAEVKPKPDVSSIKYLPPLCEEAETTKDTSSSPDEEVST